MLNHKALNRLISILMVLSLLFNGSVGIIQVSAQGASSPVGNSTSAMPMNPTDETKVPHYFGPWSNYANSSFTVPDVTVEITGDGAGAMATATVGAGGAITGITITDPGSGYTSASAVFTSATGTGATADVTVNTSGVVTSITVDTPGAGYIRPSVMIGGGGGTGTLTQVGNTLIDRVYATDSDAVSPVPVFVIVPTPLPVGFLTDFLTLNQALAGSSPTPSAGQSFNAYVLRPTGVANEYQIIFDSGSLIVPALADPGVSEMAAFPVGNVAVQAGDVLAFYGAGIPFDTGSGADIFSYPAPSAPTQGATITIGDPATFPLGGEARTYSFAANVVDTSGVVPVTNATATAYGGVDQVLLTTPGTGYIFPTVDFDLPDDPNGIQAKAHAEIDGNGAITAIVVDTPGSGYTSAPGVAILDGTRFNPVAHTDGSFVAATAETTLSITAVELNTFGGGYSGPPTVTISDLTSTGSGATATAHVNAGAVTNITLTSPGTGYVTQGGIKKFQDGLPMLCDPSLGCTDNNLGQHIPLAVPDQTTFPGTDYYVIALVQHMEQMHSDLPPTLLREYVQLETTDNASWSKHVALQTDLLGNTSTPTLMPDGSQAYAVDDPHYLGPIIVAQKDRAVRIVFYNLLPTGSAGDLFLPVDTTFMGAGMGPMMMMPAMDMGSVTDMVRNPACGEAGRSDMTRMDCFAETRATLHLHGGITPWISDGSPHQWITPANEMTGWPEGVAVRQVPDMVGGAQPASVPDCSAADDGCMTFYYTNQQSARLMFYHDHAWGITRLNVYAGEAAGYLIRDDTEQSLIDRGLIPSGADEIPLVVQDRTFVPNPAQMAAQDPTWDYTRWGDEGDLWYEHVYMPAQNPGDPGGMSAYGRWMYGPWFWPPANPEFGAIDNPYYDPNCNLDDPATWQYDIDPFCEPPQIPGTPNNSAGMEQFNDTPIVNGTAYPTVTLEPKSYRFRILNAANDRFWNLQWYVGDPTTADAVLGPTEVALKASEVEAAQTDPNIFPTPDTTISPPGPSWIQIGTEGGFLPAPAVIPNQPITWIIDPTRFDVGNVDKHSLLLAPAERADVIVDFSKFAGKTLILYNDAPAAFPARVACYDYYTGGPDLSPACAPSTLPGYGPNTRTIMQVKIAAAAPAPAFNLTALRAAFRHHADGSGVFEAGQNPIITGQAAYNSAYGTSFASAGWCNSPTKPSAKCDGFARISEQGGNTFKFDTLAGPQIGVKIEPKAIHDETNSTNFEPYGRMSGNLGVEVVPATPNGQNVVLYPFVNPPTELFDGTNLPSSDTITPISVASDGTQIWKFTHNGVDTHPIHFHLYDVQLLNRVTWDNIVIAPDPNELGWKDTVRVSPLEDTYFAIRPVLPVLPWEIPNSIRPMNPMMPINDTTMFNPTDPNGNPAAISNQLVNFGWEYMLHCHILSHEEMDMMRPASVAVPPNKPDGLAAAINGSGQLVLSWNDNSITETSFLVQRTEDTVNWVDLGTVQSPLDQPNIHELRTYTDTTYQEATFYQYRVVAKNTVGYGGAFPSLTAQSISDPLAVGTEPPPAAPSALTVTIVPGPLQLGARPPFLLGAQSPRQLLSQVPLHFGAQAQALSGPQVQLQWTDNSATETGFTIERCTGVGCTDFAPIDGVGTDAITYDDLAITANTSYSYRVFAFSAAGNSATSNIATIFVPAAPTVVSIMRASPNPTNAASVDYTVTFSGDVTGVDIADFGLTTTGTIVGTSVAGVTGTGATRTVTISTGTGEGTLALQVLDTATITDLVGNQLTGLPFSTPNQEYTIYQAIPTVVSIVRASPNPTSAASVDYTVTFSEAVTGVDTTDFAITAGGLVANPYVVSVSQPDPAQPVYTVAVNTGTGSGTLRLDLIDNDSILSAFAVPLGGPGAQNYTSGEVYDLDKLAPTVVSIVRASANPTNAASLDYTVAFSEPVTGVDAADFAVALTGSITGASVTNVTGTGASYTVTVNTGTDSGTLRLDMPVSASLADTAGNAIGSLPFTGGEVYDLDKTPPTVVSIVRASQSPTAMPTVDYTVTFSELVTGIDTGDFIVTLNGITGATVTSVSQPDPNQPVYMVVVNAGTGTGTLRLDMPASASVADGVGNALGNAPFTGGEIYTTVPLLDTGIYDDNNVAWQYASGWVSSTQTGPANNTIHSTNIVGNTTDVWFTGVKFVLTYTKAPNRGSFEVWLDNTTLVTTINANSTSTQWQQIYSSPVYSNGIHKLTIKHTGSAGTYIDVDAIQIVPPVTPAGPGIYDDTDYRWDYSNNWATIAGSTGPYGNTIHYTETTDSTASFTFQAPAVFTFYYAKFTQRGTFEIWVDGVRLTTINPYATTKSWQNKYTSPIYNDTGAHTVTIKNISTGGKQVDVDAIEIMALPPAAGPGIYDDTDAHWMYSADWAPITGATGPYNGTFHYTQTTNASAYFTFQAPASFTFYYAKFNQRGTFEIWVDGVRLTTINPYSTVKSWQNKYTSPVYNDTGAHTVTIKNISTGGKQVDVDAIEITAPPPPAGPGVYDDTDAHWMYSADWAPITGATGPYNGTFHYTQTTGGTASFTFQGPGSFTFYYAKFNQRGTFEIWVDGNLLTTINPYSTVKTWQNTYTSPYFSGTGPHTVVIKNISTSGLQVDVDVITINP